MLKRTGRVIGVVVGLIGWTVSVMAEPPAPIARWTFDQGVSAVSVGSLRLDGPGPRPPFYPGFPAGNKALVLDAPSWLAIPDEGHKSRFDFDNGDAITLEAWVRPDSVPGEHVYLISKGRTDSSGAKSMNQNWALRLRKQGSGLALNFLFRSRADDNMASDWHRWTSKTGLEFGSRWHHVAISYRFGDSKSIRGYIDGKSVKGTWDMGGATNRPPVVDDDEVRIGSAYGGLRTVSLDGALDEIAIHRRIVPADELRSRFVWDPPKQGAPRIPPGQVVVQLFGPVSSASEFPRYLESPRIEWVQDSMGFTQIPFQYDEWGIRKDWGQTLLMRAWCDVDLEPGTYQWLTRSRGRSRLLIDDKVVVETAAQKGRGSAHNLVQELPKVPVEGMRPHWMNDQEAMVSLMSKGGRHRVLYEAIVGGPSFRLELGESLVALARPREMFHVLSANRVVPLTDAGWKSVRVSQRVVMEELNRKNRQRANEQQADYWQRRHAHARRTLLGRGDQASIDQLVADRIAARETRDASSVLQPLVADQAFLRRVFLDTVGVPPTLEEARTFLEDRSTDRRSRLVDRLLNDPRWADNWVGYWQDVLAENPNLLKPKLNNTGPFRWWIHEALVDNKPIDRFATELILMRGSTWGGGTAGFAIASENDVPMAAKAHVVASAFLGINMKCARCHDAPYHRWKQSDLFHMAAMLDRKQLKLPGTSTVPAAFFEEQARDSLIEATLRPGTVVKPRWPFEQVRALETDQLGAAELDTRQQVALEVTGSRRFAEVIANRVWARLMGEGLVSPVDDWENNPPSHPRLLALLADELIRHDYNVRELARVIFHSQVYQREAIPLPQTGERYFQGPYRRRLTAEQIVDSAFHVVGQQINTEPLTLDIEGTYTANRFLHFGFPRHAWEFTTMGNERDRPSLAIPRVQAITDVLKAFGWRNSRPEPISEREQAPNLLQPAVLANGTVGVWLTRLSDESGLTALALKSSSVESLVDDLFMQLLTRTPTADERDQFVAALKPGYEDRVVPADEILPPIPPRRYRYVSWSNHLSPDANSIKIALQEVARRGDPPTRFLRAAWRERMEDAVWALFNNPEWIMVP